LVWHNVQNWCVGVLAGTKCIDMIELQRINLRLKGHKKRKKKKKKYEQTGV